MDGLKTAVAAVIDAQQDVTARRRANERRVVEALVSRGLSLGYAVSVFDGEEVVVHKAEKLSDVMAGLFACDDETLVFHTAANQRLVARLVYGNGDGFEVIQDYSSKLEPVVEWVEERLFREDNR